MNENISRSSIFRSKMKIDAAKRSEEEKSDRDIERTKRSKFFHSTRRTSLPKSKEDIGKEPGE